MVWMDNESSKMTQWPLSLSAPYVDKGNRTTEDIPEMLHMIPW